MKIKKGISLIVLIITIIVVIILAAVVILTISKNNPIESAKEARFKEEVRTFQDELALAVSKQYTTAGGHRDTKITTSDFNEITEYIPSFTKKYEGKFIIRDDELIYTNKLDDKEKKYVESLHINKRSVLPEEYQELDYLESTGTQYIDTKFKENSPSAGYYAKYQNSADHRGDDAVMGVLSPNRCLTTSLRSAATCWKESGVGSDGSQLVAVVSTDIVESYLNYLNSQKRRIDVNEQTKMIGDISSVTSINNKSCYIFATNYGSPYGNVNGVRIFNAKITLNDKVVRNFIPCRALRQVENVEGTICNEGTLGMYDIVEGKFYTNKGSGEFLPGCEI